MTDQVEQWTGIKMKTGRTKSFVPACNAKLYDEETIYGYLTYLTYRVEDALFTWKKESDVDGFWADLTWEEYIAFLQREKSLVLAAQRVLLSTVIAFPASAFDFTLAEAELDFPVTRYDSAGMLHMAKLYSSENYISIVEFLMFRAERAYYLLQKKQRGPTTHGSFISWSCFTAEGNLWTPYQGPSVTHWPN